jgi:hypothetical protein
MKRRDLSIMSRSELWFLSCKGEQQILHSAVATVRLCNGTSSPRNHSNGQIVQLPYLPPLPVSITPPTHHTRLFISHLHCIAVARDGVVT